MAEPIAIVEEFEIKRRFRPTRFRNIRLTTDRPFLVKNLIPREGLTVIWGPPKCGKTFWCFDLALHVALGWEYRGRRVQPGTVVYIACEGERGLGARTEAFRSTRLAEAEDDDPPFFLLPTRLDLVADVDELMNDIRAAIGADHCAAIVLDTLNRSIAGSESRDEDMSAYVKAADLLREKFRCAVIIIHHCGISGERPRGHTSLTGAADAQLSVKRDGAGRVVATVEYMKDGPEGAEIVSRLCAVDVGIDEDGDPITSCLVEEAEGGGEQSGPGNKPRLRPKNRIALDLLRKAINETGKPMPPSSHAPSQALGVGIETWRAYFRTGTADDGQTSDARKKAFQRARDFLQSAGVIGIWNEFVWIVAGA